ncbi:hypothetical protein GCM10010302_49160 [Streptomyces polychromogenes]|uniref:Uncharacterized protein n=1 Tax=Streptomyces polychromogenes TaxID=67342 RepID=A0ABP3F5H3_9ACTN
MAPSRERPRAAPGLPGLRPGPRASNAGGAGFWPASAAKCHALAPHTPARLDFAGREWIGVVVATAWARFGWGLRARRDQL